MASRPGAGYHTALTLAAFGDLRFYKANHSKVETMK